MVVPTLVLLQEVHEKSIDSLLVLLKRFLYWGGYGQDGVHHCRTPPVLRLSELQEDAVHALPLVVDSLWISFLYWRGFGQDGVHLCRLPPVLRLSELQEDTVHDLPLVVFVLGVWNSFDLVVYDHNHTISNIFHREVFWMPRVAQCRPGDAQSCPGLSRV